LSYTALYIF